MSIRGLKKWALLLTFWVALQTRYLRADETVTGNLTVTGTTDTQGNTLALGTRTDTSTEGAQLLYTDGATSTLEFDASRGANIWKWQQNGGTALQLQMSLNLSNNNELVLYNQASTPVAKITLNPLGTSTFVNSLTVNGTDNEMPNQTLVGANSVLTRGLADSRYLSFSSGATSLSLFGASATGLDSVAFGHTIYGASTASGAYSFACGAQSSASGDYSTALGKSYASGKDATAMSNGIASGYYATAMGSGATASGSHATAMGDWSTAGGTCTMASGGFTTASGAYSMATGGFTTSSGIYSTAMGSLTLASGLGSTAMGKSTTAPGNYSTALGYNTTTNAFGSVALGKYNVGAGTYNAWVTTEALLELGNGTDSSHLSDALVVYKNGSATFQGVVTANAGVLTTAASIATTDIPMFGH